MLNKYKPVTPGMRGTVLVSKKHLSTEKPVKCLDGYSEVLFVARIPINIIRKELN